MVCERESKQITRIRQQGWSSYDVIFMNMKWGEGTVNGDRRLTPLTIIHFLNEYGRRDGMNKLEGGAGDGGMDSRYS